LTTVFLIKYVLVKSILLFFLVISSVASSFAQSKDYDIPPFQRFPTFPPIQILLSDSTTVYTKAEIPTGKPTLFIIFSPDCSHCQDETTQMVAHMDELKDVQIIMITYHPLSQMKDFVATYGLEKYPNIVVGKDVQYVTATFYSIRNIPCMALYNKEGKLIEKLEGTHPIEEVITAFKTNQ